MRYHLTNSVIRFCLVAILTAVCGAPACAENVHPLELGAKAPSFKLPGVDGRDYQLSDFDDAKVLVIVFTCNHCPTAQAYEDRLIKLSKDYRARGVALVAISPNDPKAVRLDELGYTDLGDSFEDMKLRAKDKAFPFPYLYDGETQATSRAFGVLATPHVFIFDKDRKLRYVGRVDSTEDGAVKSPDARNAIEALLAGRDVAVAKTRVRGCSTKWSDKRASARTSLERWNKEPVTLETIDAQGVVELAKNAPTNVSRNHVGKQSRRRSNGASGSLATGGKKYRLINVWATWCGSCVTELPELVTINRMYRRRPFEVITISLDDVTKREAVLETLKREHVACRNYIFSSSDQDALAEALDKKWEGPVPYTILVAPGGKIVYRKQGPFDPLELKRAIVAQLGRTY